MSIKKIDPIPQTEESPPKKYMKTRAVCKICGKRLAYFARNENDIRDNCNQFGRVCYEEWREYRRKHFPITYQTPIEKKPDKKSVRKHVTPAKIRKCKKCGAAFKLKLRTPNQIYCCHDCAPHGFRLDGEKRKVASHHSAEKLRERATKAANRRWELWRENHKDPKYIEGKYPEHWKDIASIIRKRDKHTCSLCRKRLLWIHQGIEWPTGHIHHIDENKGNNNPENLVTLCRNCHFRSIHKYHRSRWVAGKTNRTVQEWRVLWSKNLSYWIEYFGILMHQPDIQQKNEGLREEINGLLF